MITWSRASISRSVSSMTSVTEEPSTTQLFQPTSTPTTLLTPQTLSELTTALPLQATYLLLAPGEISSMQIKTKNKSGYWESRGHKSMWVGQGVHWISNSIGTMSARRTKIWNVLSVRFCDPRGKCRYFLALFMETYYYLRGLWRICTQGE